MNVETLFSVVNGFEVTRLEPLGHLMVRHDGSITWDQLQDIKNEVWGSDAAAIEVYPPRNMTINSIPARHLWRLGSGDFWPDMMGAQPKGSAFADTKDMLEARYRAAWSEAWAQLGEAA